MVKCHYTTHHHRWFLGASGHYECEYCETALVDYYEVLYCKLDYNELIEDAVTQERYDAVLYAIVQYLWEQQEEGQTQSSSLTIAQEIHMDLFYSTEEDFETLPPYLPVGDISTPRISQNFRCPHCKQTTPAQLRQCQVCGWDSAR